MIFELWTDGSCYPNPGSVGGWAYVLHSNATGNRVSNSGKIEGYVTNNISEMTAVIQGLSAIPIGAQTILRCDSSYVVNGINQWRFNWRKHNWQGVKNAELWKQLDELLRERHVETVWIRGHSGCVENEECDRLAGEAYRDGI